MEWFEKWFNSLYFQIYSHRTLEQAALEVEGLLRLYPALKTAQVLDIGCGNGRHLIELTKNCRFAAGVELSSEALQQAQGNSVATQISLRLVRGDFRCLPFRSGSFTAACSFFNSFGYLESDQAHQNLLREWRRVLSQDGVLFIDFANRDYLLRNLVPSNTRMAGDLKVSEKRTYIESSSRIEKEIIISGPEVPETRYLESIRLYTYTELLSMLEVAGFQQELLFGDFTGESFSPNSPRLLLLAKAI